MKLDEFEKELTAINKDLSIFSSDRPTAEIRFRGAFLCAIPNHDIYDEPSAHYGIETPSGDFIPHRGRKQALDMVQGQLKKLEDKDEHDAFFGEGEYSDKELGIRLGNDIAIDVEASEETKQE